MSHSWNTEKIEEIIEKAETISIDLKQAAPFSGDFAEKITKTIAAMANTKNGGVILVGIRDDKSVIDCTDILGTWDKTKVTNHLRKKLNPMPSFEILSKKFLGKLIIILEIHEFLDLPILVKETITINNKTFTPGTIFIRTVGAETKIISTEDEMRNFLKLIVARKVDLLRRDFYEIINGKSLSEAPEPSIDSDFKKYLPDWEEKKKLHKFSKANIEIKIVPLGYLYDNSKSQKFDEICRNIVYDDPYVIGHSFPYYYTARENINKYPDYMENLVKLHNIPYQYWQLNYNGTIGILATIWSEIQNDEYWNSHISLNGICDLIFQGYVLSRNICRFYESDKVFLSFSLNNVLNKSLGDEMKFLHFNKTSNVNSYTFSKVYTSTEISNLQNYYNEAIKKILYIFDEFEYIFKTERKGWQ